jgi:hypothetical protein
MENEKSGSKTQIIIAIIGLIGVLGTAIFTNWDRIFPDKTPQPVASSKAVVEAPKVIATSPSNGATDIDPSLNKISVTFNRPMQDKTWSWTDGGENTMPEATGESSYIENGTTCILLVTLKPGRKYVVWVNSATHKNFKDKNGVAAEPYRIEFSTKAK